MSDERAMMSAAPARRGYRWPAEWERHRATWLSWPHNKDTWPNGLEPVEDAFCEIVRALLPGEDVEINVLDEAMAKRVGERLRGAGVLEGSDAEERVRFHLHPTDDAWVRDHGAIILTGGPEGAERLALDFEYDAWGGKYPPWDLDAAVARSMATALGVPRFESAYVLEGGAIDGDGDGTILTTESCLLNANRLREGQTRGREAMESLLRETLGARRVLWLGDGIEGDDTDGHVDDLTRFVSPGRVVTIVEKDSRDPNFEPLRENRRRLSSMRDAADRLLDVVELPTAGTFAGPHGRAPASYANFYIANAGVLLPVFGVDRDREAIEVLSGCFPDRPILPIPARSLVEGLGAVHCLTQQEPAAG